MLGQPHSACQLEIACFSVESALVAIKAGADRIELCGGPPSSGGLTPTKEDLERVKNAAGNVPVHVMIRPRAGNFVYTEAEIETMEASINELGQLANGFVFGVLKKEGDIDDSCCARLLAATGQKPCVFHRAVDDTKNYVEALDVIRDLGFVGILTSGTRATALEGTEELKEAIQYVGNRLQVIVGGGVRSKHLTQLRLDTNARWFHSSALVDGGEVADAEEIKAMVNILRRKE
jgi:copper homeostasis protein